MTASWTGTLAIPEPGDGIPPTAPEAIDAALATLRERAPVWIDTDVPARLALLEELVDDTLASAPAWATAAAAAKGIRSDSPLMGEDWISGPVMVLRNLRLLQRSLGQIVETGRPQPPSLEVAANGQVVARVFPSDTVDQLMFPQFTGEIRLRPDVPLDRAEARIGRIHREGTVSEPTVALVLGAGNVSSIGPMDALYELFARNRVVLLKMNPVNAHLGPHVAAAFQPLVREGFLRIVYGGAEVGRHLTDHPEVDTIHVTGSDKTYDAIVFGTGEAGARRKAAGERRLDKPVTAELGNVSPVIVVPGPWNDKDLAFHGDNIASMLVNNGGFNCIAARVVVQHRQWAKRRKLLDAVRDSLRGAEPRVPYYPGAVDRWRQFTDAHPSAEWFGDAPDDDHPDRLPFTLIPDLDAHTIDDVAFTTEAFCGVFGEVALDAPRSVADYLEAAVAFCNDTLWGTLSASLLVHPDSLKDPEIANAVERAIDRLRYGSVVVNHWSAVPYGMVSTTWGAYPGAEPTDIQSGTGVVHNTYLLEDVEKTVVRGPFRPPMKPVWFHTHRGAAKLAPKLARLVATGERRQVPGILWQAVRG
ncbi:aldehyde dehydrogenase family protein [Egicoccus halophilus]|uniref:Putative aldehyde dehydrogenase n=1 Tax=Egicoccus halophilus TaxID=1670830 RepID=A0A8J3AAQ5_9ACTN|nr:aldehyde dehydrogenase family protein [Egicoccus halophilus]GGI06829.1 putative aldehyde dehydrogenase [Egicoccus halophilus]